jgi:hypothetical protein
VRDDPCQVVFDALEQAGCEPRGPIWKFTSRCPAHDDSSPSLSVCEGVDKRLVLHCHAYCEPAAVVRALELHWGDLFPNGHRHARRAVQPKVRTERPIVSIRAALATAGIGWRQTASTTLFVADFCPRCEAGSLWIADAVSEVRLACWSAGCDSHEILQALEARLTEAPRAA